MPFSDEFLRFRSGGFAASAQTFTTTFSATENPISESSAWIKQTPDPGVGAHNGWHNVRTTGGNAVATFNAGITAGGPGSGDYDDSYAYLNSLWSGSQEAEAVVYKGLGGTEVELLLRCSDTTTTVQTYEITYNLGGQCAIVRWNGPQDDFTILIDSSTGLTDQGTMSDGDLVRARIVGQLITIYYAPVSNPSSWVTLGSYTDNAANKIISGAPGIGFFARTPLSLDYGFKSFTARAL